MPPKTKILFRFLWGLRLDGLDHYCLNALPKIYNRGYDLSSSTTNSLFSAQPFPQPAYSAKEQSNYAFKKERVTKALQTNASYQKRILLLKHPYTWLTERFFQSLVLQPAIIEQGPIYLSVLNKFKKKEVKRDAVNFSELIGEAVGISTDQAEQFLRQTASLDLDFLAEMTKNWQGLVFKFEDFEQKNLNALNRYLGVDILKAARQIPELFRAWPQSLKWQAWLSPDDQKLCEEIAKPYFTSLGYSLPQTQAYSQWGKTSEISAIFRKSVQIQRGVLAANL